MKDGIINFFLIAIVSFAIGILTYLISNDAIGSASPVAAGFAGIASGVATDLGYEIGLNDFSKRKWNVVCGMVGAVVGGLLGSFVHFG